MLRVGASLAIMGDWDAAEAPGNRLVIQMPPPGSVFGAGWHWSTRACLEELERDVRPGMTLIDVGTGTGILAVAAALLGGSRVIATERHRQSFEFARGVVELNGVAHTVKLRHTEQVPRDQADLVVANLGGLDWVEANLHLIDAPLVIATDREPPLRRYRK